MDAFVQEEVNNVARSDMFLDVFLTDEYNSLEYNQEEEVYGVSTSDDNTITFLPPNMRARRARYVAM